MASYIASPAFAYTLDTPAQVRFEDQGGHRRGLQRQAFDWRLLTPIAATRAGAGLNMIFRRSLLEGLGEVFPPELDAGTPTESGGDMYALYRLLAAGLLDELRLLVHPIAVRKGMRLFDEGERPIPLRLISSEAFSTGVLNLVYGPGESTGDATYEDAKVHLSQPER